MLDSDQVVFGDRGKSVVVGGVDKLDAILYNKTGQPLGANEIKSLECPYCNMLLRDPQQLLTCGHRYCKSCLERVKNKSPPKCLVDNEIIIDNEIKPDRGCQKEFERLQAECAGKSNGCKWRGEFLLLEDHMTKCSVIKRFNTCKYCGKIIALNKMEKHLKDCDYQPQICDLCNYTIPKVELAKHKTTDCPESNISCEFAGCRFKAKRSKLNEHYQDHMHELMINLNGVLEMIKQLLQDNAHLQRNQRYLNDKISEHKKEIDSLTSSLQVVFALKKDIEKLQIELLNIEDNVRQQKVSLDSGIESLPGSDDEMRALGNRVVRLEQDMLVLRPSVEEVKHGVKRFQSQLVGYVDAVQTIKETITRHAIAMDEVKLRQDILDVKTINGIFIWKIPEIERRFRDAQDRRTLSLYSPPFHTSPHGYRMCIRAYLNGDGSGKGTYVSVFFVLMKSEHDDLLPWPFRRPVTFDLINQENQSQNISETFMPDVHSPSFQKPKSEMNIASGFPRFAKQSVLTDKKFVKDDAIFIRCRIDTSGLNLE